MNLGILSQADLRRMKRDLAERKSRRATKRLHAVLAELNARFDHIPSFVTLSNGRKEPIRKCVEIP